MCPLDTNSKVFSSECPTKHDRRETTLNRLLSLKWLKSKRNSFRNFQKQVKEDHNLEIPGLEAFWDFFSFTCEISITNTFSNLFQRFKTILNKVINFRIFVKTWKNFKNIHHYPNPFKVQMRKKNFSIKTLFVTFSSPNTYHLWTDHVSARGTLGIGDYRDLL